MVSLVSSCWASSYTFGENIAGLLFSTWYWGTFWSQVTAYFSIRTLPYKIL